MTSQTSSTESSCLTGSSRLTAAEIPTEDHRNLLDIIDGLRSQGLSRYIDLPEIIVCGDQSAGKSSVLEAISCLQFPTKDGLCTRFATELILRRGEESSTKVRITPGEGRYDKDKMDLEAWKPCASIDEDGLGAITVEALQAMSASGDRRFYSDILRIERTGPTQPHLTMVDLPGLFRAGNKEQSDKDVEMVCTMVTNYMARPRSIILAVVSAKNEYVLQEVTALAKRADPEGLRTMGLITKPDTLDVGSDSESRWVQIAQNKEVELRLGWHTLRNRNFEQRNSTSAERDVIEDEFFRTGIWVSVNPSHCGVSALRVRLSTILKHQILSQLPGLHRDIEAGISQCTKDLDRLGPRRETPEQQRRYLVHLSRNYTSLMEQATNGIYTKEFFGNMKEADSFGKRLRAVVQNRLQDFAQEMCLNGQSQLIVDSDAEEEEDTRESQSDRVRRSEYLADVAIRLRRIRGCELPGLFNPLIVSNLFAEQCEPWGKLVEHLVDDILSAVQTTTRLVIEHIAAKDVLQELLNFVYGQIEELKINLDKSVQALLKSSRYRAITYNRELTESVQKTHNARHKRVLKQQIMEIFGLSEFDTTGKKVSINPAVVYNTLAEERGTDMEVFGSSLAVDYMQAYYKVALNRFIDDISVIAIEDCLVDKVSGLLDSVKVDEMNPEEISRLAAESSSSTAERDRLKEKRRTLEQALRGLRGLLQQDQLPSHLERVTQSAVAKRSTIVEEKTVPLRARSRSPLFPLTPPSQDRIARSASRDRDAFRYSSQQSWGWPDDAQEATTRV